MRYLVALLLPAMGCDAASASGGRLAWAVESASCEGRAEVRFKEPPDAGVMELRACEDGDCRPVDGWLIRGGFLTVDCDGDEEVELRWVGVE